MILYSAPKAAHRRWRARVMTHDGDAVNVSTVGDDLREAEENAASVAGLLLRRGPSELRVVTLAERGRS